ncbi:MAG: glycosyltransferase [Acidimicrobiia bacterium]
MKDVVAWFLVPFSWFVLAYFLVLNSSYLVLLVIASRDAFDHYRRRPYDGHDDIFANPLTPPVTVVVPAYNEETHIVESVRALLALKYPQLEIVVVDDGSTDETFGRLAGAFDLVEVPRVIPDLVPTLGRVLSSHVPRGGDPLVVVRKENTGRRSDPTNVGINAATSPLVCFIDADAILDEEALLRVVKPFVDRPERVVGTGGCIRAANGLTIYRGRIVETRFPRRWLERIQVVEYLRAFLLGRAGWSRLKGLLIISGAFGMFRRDLLIDIGGFDLHCIGEDAELVTRLHRYLRDRKWNYEFEFVAEPVCWTEVPPTRAALAHQRRRWSRGLAQTLWKHRSMIGNPRYGRIGLVVVPYYLVFELLSPFVELFGVVAVAAGLVFGLVNVPFAIVLFLAAVCYGVLLSLTTVVVEEFSYRRYRRWRDLAGALAAAVLENVGFRQMHAWWRWQGLLDTVLGTKAEWVKIERSGFEIHGDDGSEEDAAVYRGPERRDPASVGAALRPGGSGIGPAGDRAAADGAAGDGAVADGSGRAVRPPGVAEAR